MSKSIMVAVLACLPAALSAQVVLYGEIKAGVSAAHVQSGQQSVVRKGTVDDFGSNIGVRGSQDLGNGVRAIWQFKVDTPVSNSNSGSMRDYFRQKKESSPLVRD